jgi:putative ABC transport system permease protein
MQVEGSTKFVTALDFETITDMFELDIVDGDVPPGSKGVLVDSEPAADLGIQAGDTITAVFNETGPVELPVLAVFENDAIVGTWVIDLETYDENFSENLDAFVTATTAEGVSPEEARAAIEAIVEPFPFLEVQDAEEFQASQESQLDTVLIVVNFLLLFAIFIAFIGITNTLALSVFERTRELGLLRAIGETRSQVWGMITQEAIIVSLFGAALGVIVGLGFGIATSSALPDSFITTIDIPFTSIVIIFVLAAILGVVAALYPAWRATRLDVLDAVAFE